VDYRSSAEALVTIAYEFAKGEAAHKKGDIVTVLDMIGNVLGNVEVVSSRLIKANDRTVILKIRAPYDYAKKIAGIRVQPPEASASLEQYIRRLSDDIIVCRCERVTMGEIKDLIIAGSRDVNEIKAITRAGMGACGGKTCETIVLRAFAELGIPQEQVTPHVHRPLFIEVPFGILAGVEKDE
jgi:bacterioferritin-associated ferredoxin